MINRNDHAPTRRPPRPRKTSLDDIAVLACVAVLMLTVVLVVGQLIRMWWWSS